MGQEVIVGEKICHDYKMEDRKIINILISILRVHTVCVVIAVYDIFYLAKQCALWAPSIQGVYS